MILSKKYRNLQKNERFVRITYTYLKKSITIMAPLYGLPSDCVVNEIKPTEKTERKKKSFESDAYVRVN